MSVLLRHPATVPALFSRAVEIERPTRVRAMAGRPRPCPASLGAASAWAAVVMIEVILVQAPLAKAAAALLGLALPG